MSSKISDLQGIRGIAILAVLGFHFYPKIMPNGYLGVDMFFVLSGFLMCMLLRKSENMNFVGMLKHFYTRRLKRILPLYQLIILLSLLLVFFFFPETSFEPNRITGKNALLFMSNSVKTDQENYFEKMLNAVDVLTHTWSLSVEVQFYAIVPFIFLLPKKIVSFSVVAIISIMYHYYLPPNAAFSYTSARIWQFLTGMIAFILRKKVQSAYRLLSNDDCEKQDKILVTVRTYDTENFALTAIMIICIFLPIQISATVARPLVTFLTGLIITITSGESLFLSNRLLTYIGDISYSLYLVHWPIYSYWKATQSEHACSIVVFIVTSVILSIIIYHSFEKWYTTSSNLKVLCLCFALFLTNAVVLNYHHTACQTNFEFNNISSNMKMLDESEKLNSEWTLHDFKNMMQETCGPNLLFGWCNQTGLNPSNKYKMMVIGNSWAANHGRIIYEECGKKANTLIQGVKCACEPLFPSKLWNGCDEALENFEKNVEEVKPDIVFHVTRYISYHENPSDDFENDPQYQFMLKKMRALLKNIKHKLYFLNAIPQIDSGQVSQIVNDIRKNMSFAEIDKKMTFDTVNYLIVRKRYAQLVKDCGSKCELIDYLDVFYRNDTQTFRYFNDFGHSYFTYELHFTPPGLERIRPVWRRVCEQL